MNESIGTPAVMPNMPPKWVFAMFNPVAKFLMRIGVPLGLNGLITVRGRKSGLPRTTPVAIIDVDGRRWVWAPWGDVQWVRNLRAAGRATITVRRQEMDVRARELDPSQRVAFFRDVLGPLVRGIPGGVMFIRIFDGVDVNQPEAAAEGRRVFELLSESQGTCRQGISTSELVARQHAPKRTMRAGRAERTSIHLPAVHGRTLRRIRAGNGVSRRRTSFATGR